jgi:hypothetical protein
MKKIIPFLSIVAVLFSVSAVHAENLTLPVALGINSQAAVHADKTSVDVRADLKADTKSKDRANAEIDRRNTVLAKLKAKIDAMKRISTESKTNLKASLDTQIAALGTLKAKISADTDQSAIKADIASITKNYRIFMVVVPQGAIMATADRINATATLMTDFGSKLQTRISTAKSDGHDVSALETAYADYTAKVKDATVQADAAIDLTADLEPDNGDKSVADANKKALVAARAKVKAGESDLRAARKDALTIIKGLKEFSIKASTTANVR